eukprot:Selendium_serpulae@DN5774_c0_g1_i9.p1
MQPSSSPREKSRRASQQFEKTRQMFCRQREDNSLGDLSRSQSLSRMEVLSSLRSSERLGCHDAESLGNDAAALKAAYDELLSGYHSENFDRSKQIAQQREHICELLKRIEGEDDGQRRCDD